MFSLVLCTFLNVLHKGLILQDWVFRLAWEFTSSGLKYFVQPFLGGPLPWAFYPRLCNSEKCRHTLTTLIEIF